MTLVSAMLCALAWPLAGDAGPQRGASFAETLAQAEKLFDERDYDEALTLYKRANAQKGSACAECLWGMAQSYSGLGAQKSVLETCERLAVAAGSDNLMAARAYNLKGVTLADLATEDFDQLNVKQLAEAEAAFRKTLALQPAFDLVHYNLGVTLIRLGREPEGVEQLKQYLAVAAKDDEDIVRSAQKTIANPQLARQNYAPEFSFNTVEGKPISSGALRGKVVLMDFWGTWCRPCVVSVPGLAALNKRFSEQPFAMISVSSDIDYEGWRGFIRRRNMTWAQVLDDKSKVQRSFAVRAFPTYVLIDHEGVIRFRTSGFSPGFEDELASAINKALNAARSARSSPSND